MRCFTNSDNLRLTEPLIGLYWDRPEVFARRFVLEPIMQYPEVTSATVEQAWPEPGSLKSRGGHHLEPQGFKGLFVSGTAGHFRQPSQWYRHGSRVLLAAPAKPGHLLQCLLSHHLQSAPCVLSFAQRGTLCHSGSVKTASTAQTRIWKAAHPGARHAPSLATCHTSQSLIL